jgi:hypothetical protein
MKYFFSLTLFCIACCAPLFGQITYTLAPDTLLYQNFDSDTFNLPNVAPTGNDQYWVNYDQDGVAQICFENVDTYGWYPLEDVNNALNYTYSSCSFTLQGSNVLCPGPNRNWLIMPPIFVEREKTFLDWKSLSFYGPYFLDGYKVLVSTTDNLPTSFTDTVYVAAECTDNVVTASLNVNQFNYSPGYIHANGYTNTDYFFDTLDFTDQPYLQGKLEPHSIDLSKYVGQSIYCAFLHDSYCDYFMQLDDVLIVDKLSDDTYEAAETISAMSISPNPATTTTRLKLTAKRPTQADLRYFDLSGRLLKTEPLNIYGGQNTYALHLEGFAPGMYLLEVVSPQERHLMKLVLR